MWPKLGKRKKMKVKGPNMCWVLVTDKGTVLGEPFAYCREDLKFWVVIQH